MLNLVLGKTLAPQMQCSLCIHLYYTLCIWVFALHTLILHFMYMSVRLYTLILHFMYMSVRFAYTYITFYVYECSLCIHLYYTLCIWVFAMHTLILHFMYMSVRFAYTYIALYVYECSLCIHLYYTLCIWVFALHTLILHLCIWVLVCRALLLI